MLQFVNCPLQSLPTVYYVLCNCIRCVLGRLGDKVTYLFNGLLWLRHAKRCGRGNFDGFQKFVMKCHEVL